MLMKRPARCGVGLVLNLGERKVDGKRKVNPALGGGREKQDSENLVHLVIPSKKDTLPYLSTGALRCYCELSDWKEKSLGVDVQSLAASHKQ